jgi:polar amino acid transport system substrate-binding protein
MKKLFSLLSVLMALVVMVGCSGGSKDALVIGVDDSYPPMEFVDDAGNLVGFDIDFATELGKELGKEIEFKSTAWDGIFIGLEAEKYDVIISSVSITAERLENFDVSEPYLSNGQVIVVANDGPEIAKIEDLGGLTVGVQIDTTSHNSASKVNETIDFELKPYDQIIQTFLELKTGRLNAIVVDSMVALEYIKNEPDTYKISSAQLSNEPIAVYFKKGANAELLKEVNAAIKKLQDNGKLAEISMKWFGTDFTSNINKELW